MRLFGGGICALVLLFLIYAAPLSADDSASPLNESAEYVMAQLSAFVTEVIDNSTKETLSRNDARLDEKPEADSYRTNILTEIADPLEPLNRITFGFNDVLFTVLLKPLTSGYNMVVAEDVRISVDNFFYNLFMPVRFVNAVLQLKFEDAGTELLRFGINSTIGIAGLADFATSEFNLDKKDKDTGQTLAYYGLGHGFYIVWPFLGPMSFRNAIGYVGDMYLKPINYVGSFNKSLSLTAYRFTNNLSLHTDDYETLRESAIDPYVSLRDAYTQHRASLEKK